MEVAVEAQFTASIYDVKGQKIATLFENRAISVGTYTEVHALNSSEIPQGQYLLIIENSNGATEILTLVVEK